MGLFSSCAVLLLSGVSLCLTGLCAPGIFDELHPLSLHMVGMHGAVYANYAIQNADLVLAIGSRFDDRYGYFFVPVFCCFHIFLLPSKLTSNHSLVMPLWLQQITNCPDVLAVPPGYCHAMRQKPRRLQRKGGAKLVQPTAMTFSVIGSSSAASCSLLQPPAADVSFAQSNPFCPGEASCILTSILIKWERLSVLLRQWLGTASQLWPTLSR